MYLINILDEYSIMEIFDRLDDTDKISLSSMNYYLSCFRKKFILNNVDSPFIIKKIRYLVNSINHIPLNITHLVFTDKFNMRFRKELIPNTVRKIKFGDKFNQPIDNSIPDDIINLKFGYCFNQSIIGVIPSGIKYLRFGYGFNQSIKGAIPTSIKRLTLGHGFNKRINGLSQGLESLKFGYQFNKSVKGLIPRSVKKIVFGENFKQSLQYSIPNGVEHLQLGGCNDVFHDIVPLYLDGYDGPFFPKLKYLSIGYNNKPITKILPESLETLCLQGNYNYPIDDIIPPNLKSLTLSYTFNQPILKPLPQTITSIKFNKKFNQSIVNILPLGLKK